MRQVIFDLESKMIIPDKNAVSFAWKKFSDEPTFQRYILDEAIPLIKGREVYYPLCTEFPASPGIDLIYVSTRGKLLVTELKLDTYNLLELEQELAYKFCTIEKRKIYEMRDYLKQRKLEANIKVFAGLEHTIDLMAKSSFGELFRTGRLDLGSVVFGKPKNSLIDNRNIFDIFGLLFNTKIMTMYYLPIRAFCYQDRYEKMFSYSDKHNQSLIKKRGRKRVVKSRKEIEKIITLEEQGPLPRYIYAFFKKNKGYLVVSGSGKGFCFRVRFKDIEDRPRTILEVTRKYLKIPGNLYGHSVYIKRNEAEIDHFFSTVKNIIRNKFECRETKGKSLKVFVRDVRLPVVKDTIDTFLDALNSFIPVPR